MRFPYLSFLTVVLGLALAGCPDYPPVAGYVTVPPPPATPTDDLGAADGIVIDASTAAGVVFLAYDPGTFSGTSPASGARSLDETIVRVEPADRNGTVQYGSPHYTGRVYVVYGVAPGRTEIAITFDGKSAGSIPATVLAQPSP
jgi:hypothetical protein